MKHFCQNQYCDNPGARVVPVSIETPSDQQRTLCTACEEAYTMGVQHATKTCRAAPSPGLLVRPPPAGARGLPLFRIIYMIDVNAASPLDAARHAHRIMIDPESWPPVLDVMDATGAVTHIDLVSHPAKTTAIHPLRQIHDLLHLDVIDGRESYNPDKEWDSDTMAAIAEIVARHIPRPQTPRRAP